MTTDLRFAQFIARQLLDGIPEDLDAYVANRLAENPTITEGMSVHFKVGVLTGLLLCAQDRATRLNEELMFLRGLQEPY